MYWGKGFQNARYIVSWVTPHDSRVEQVLARAAELMPSHRLPGYEEGKGTAVEERSTYLEAQAVYRAVQREGMSYVKSSLTLGGHQDWSERVRPAGESLEEHSANCIDGAVLYASLFENLGMDPVILLVPGHAFVGVRKVRSSNQFLYFETALTGRAPFEAAVSSAQHSLEKYSPSQRITVSIEAARSGGIYPIPVRSGKDIPARQQLSSVSAHP
jgi:hypothetical protein